MAIDDEVQTGHIPRLERIVKVPQEAKPVILSNAALLEPFENRTTSKFSRKTSVDAGIAKMSLKRIQRLRGSTINQSMCVRVQAVNFWRDECAQHDNRSKMNPF